MTHAADNSTTRRSSRLHDIDGDVEVLTVALAAATDPHERSELQERVVLLALPLADAIARRYVGRGIETDDLLQVGRIALVKAVHRYQPGGGAGFSAFAAPTISGEVKRWFRDHGWSVRPPRRIQELRSRLVVGEEELRHAIARDPRDDELAGALGVTAHDVSEARRCSSGYRAASLDAGTSAGGGLVDHVLVQQCPTEAVDLLHALGWALGRLPERQRLILRLRFVDELTQEQIGGHIGVSQMQVSRLLRSALDQLRRDLDSDPATPRRAA
jgi:RNA polymerase sigma-B factor